MRPFTTEKFAKLRLMVFGGDPLPALGLSIWKPEKLPPATALLALTVPEDVSEPTAVARPAVKLATETCTVYAPCSTGSTSVPARGVVAAVKAEIFLLAIRGHSL